MAMQQCAPGDRREWRRAVRDVARQELLEQERPLAEPARLLRAQQRWDFIAEAEQAARSSPDHGNARVTNGDSASTQRSASRYASSTRRPTGRSVHSRAGGGRARQMHAAAAAIRTSMAAAIILGSK